jgi:hypothetical protein
MLIDVVNVTPAMAATWLTQNHHNRNMNVRLVGDYARDMLADNWPLNGESVKFADDGTLLDGQHRLSAVVLADITVQMIVVTGLPVETQETMDAGRKRSTADILGIRGETHSLIVASVLKRVWIWQRGERKFLTNPRPTTAELTQLLATAPGEFRRAAEIADRTYRKFRFLPQSSVGTAYFVLNRIAPDDVPWFFESIATGAGLEVGNPVLTLRNRAMYDRGESKAVSDTRAMAYIVRAWNAVREGRTLDQIIQPADKPIPEPK